MNKPELNEEAIDQDTTPIDHEPVIVAEDPSYTLLEWKLFIEELIDKYGPRSVMMADCSVMLGVDVRE